MSLTRFLAALPEPLFSTYRIEKVLGEGAYAVVYQVRDVLSAEAFALKVIEKEPMRVRMMLTQLARETSLLEAHADTPHVVQLLETTMTRDHVFMRFQLCEESLEDASMHHGRMTEAEAFRWLREACIGVSGLHASGVIHRDLKPSNFLIDNEGTLRICDFGWACFEEQALSGQCGTPEYSSPETSPAHGGGVHTSKVDIYGLGATLQHLLLGRVPKGPRDLPKNLSTATLELLEELMDSDADARPSIDELLSRPQLAENIVTQLWNQWRSFFYAPNVVKRPETVPEGSVNVSCRLVGIY